MSLMNEIISKVKKRDPGETEFHQAVEEVLETLESTVEKHPEFVKRSSMSALSSPTA
jgi:glutamate dehydrogenase (NADP+)